MNVDWHYVRMSVSARKKLADAIGSKRREPYKGAMVRYTSATINLLNAILAHVDRQTGKARLAFSVLMELTGLKSRQTVARHIFLLETAGCVVVKRARLGRDMNAINVFTLVNETASAFFGTRWTPSVVKNRTDIYGYDNRTDKTKNMMDDNDTLYPSTELEDKVKSILDEHVANKVIAQYGADAVGAWYAWVMKQSEQGWVTNPGGLLVAKLRTGKNPPKEGAIRRNAKAKATVTDWSQMEELRMDYPMPLRTDAPVFGIGQGKINNVLLAWCKANPQAGSHPTSLMVGVQDGVVHYSNDAWGKRGGREVLRGIIREIYPDKTIILMDDPESAVA